MHTAAVIATHHNKMDVVDYLMSAHGLQIDDVAEIPLCIGCLQRGVTDHADWGQKHGECPVHKMTCKGRLLCTAAFTGSVEALRWLLEKGAVPHNSAASAYSRDVR